MNCKSCQVKKQSCSSRVYINIMLANRDESVHLFNFLGWFTCWPTCTPGHWTSTSINPIGLLVCVWPGSHGACPAQTGENRFNTSAQWGSKHEASICSGLWFFPERLARCTLWLSKNTLRNVASECHFLDFCTCEFWRRTTTIKLASFCSHLYWNPSYHPPL